MSLSSAFFEASPQGGLTLFKLRIETAGRGSRPAPLPLQTELLGLCKKCGASLMQNCVVTNEKALYHGTQAQFEADEQRRCAHIPVLGAE